jgi:hypothetical protein
MTKLNTGNVNSNCLSVNNKSYETIIKFRKQATKTNKIEHFYHEYDIIKLDKFEPIIN